MIASAVSLKIGGFGFFCIPKLPQEMYYRGIQKEVHFAKRECRPYYLLQDVIKKPTGKIFDICKNFKNGV